MSFFSFTFPFCIRNSQFLLFPEVTHQQKEARTRDPGWTASPSVVPQHYHIFSDKQLPQLLPSHTEAPPYHVLSRTKYTFLSPTRWKKMEVSHKQLLVDLAAVTPLWFSSSPLSPTQGLSILSGLLGNAALSAYLTFFSLLLLFILLMRGPSNVVGSAGSPVPRILKYGP